MAFGCGNGFVKCFLKVPLACFGRTGATVDPQWTVELSENILQNLFHNLTPRTRTVLINLAFVECVTFHALWALQRVNKLQSSTSTDPTGVPSKSLKRNEEGFLSAP